MRAVGDNPNKTAILTASAIGRGIAVAFSWFNPNLRAFGPDQLDEACAHLGLGEGLVVKVKLRLAELKGRVS